MDTRKPEKMRPQGLELQGGSRQQILQARLGGSHEHDRNCLRLRFRRGPRAEPGKDVPRILMM